MNTPKPKESWVTLEIVNNIRAQHGLEPFTQDQFERADKQSLENSVEFVKQITN